MEKQLRKFIRKEILKEVSTLGAIASEAGQVSVNIKGWELPPGGFKPIENVVDTLKLQLLDQQERVDHMNVYNMDKVPDTKYREVVGKDVKYDKVQKQTKEFVKKYTNKTDKMKLIGENKMKVTERKLREIIRAEIQSLTEDRATKGGTGKSIGFSGSGVQSTSRSKGRSKFSGDPQSRSAPTKRSPFKKASWAQRGGIGGTSPSYPGSSARGGARANAAATAQAAWSRLEDERIAFGTSKARELRSDPDTAYWALEAEKKSTETRIHDDKWAYAHAIVNSDSGGRDNALQSIVSAQARVKEIRSEQSTHSARMDWSRYERRR